MDLNGQVALVTGGASGIGRAMCLAFAGQGAAGVVVADVDGAGAGDVAAQLAAGECEALAVGADMSVEADVQALVAQAEARFGRIDLACSNAGIIVAGGVELPDQAWSTMWAINVHSHVYLARAVLPAMLARGAGHLMITASAAGLLTQLGSAPYAVTKHAAVALAEWLSITYGGRGIGVSCLCPQAVTTNLGATSARQVGGARWPDELGAVAVGAAGPAGVAAGRAGPAGVGADASGPAGVAAGAGTGSQQAAVDGVLAPEQVAACVVEALAQERFLILPHPEVAGYERRRADDRERWLAGMRRLQARLSPTATK